MSKSQQAFRWVVVVGVLASALIPAVPVEAQITAPGTEYVTFLSGVVRVFAQKDDTEVELIDVDTDALLSPFDLRISFFGAPSNPFRLVHAGDTYLFRGGEGPIRNEIRVRIRSRDADTDGDPLEDKPVTVWTGSTLSTRNSWGSYIPATFSSPQTFGREVGRDFLGFTQRDLILMAPTVAGVTAELTVHNLDIGTAATLTLDASFPLCPALTDTRPPLPPSATPCYLLDHPEVQTVYLTGYSDDRITVTSNVDISVLAGFGFHAFAASPTEIDFFATDWSSTPPSFAPGDDGVELGTRFYAFVRSGLAIFPTEDLTTVTITDLSDGDDSKIFTLTTAQVGESTYDIYTPYLETRLGTGIIPRPSDPQVIFTTNDENPIDNDVLKIESNKPILVYQGPVGGNRFEYADVAFSVPTGPQSRLLYVYAMNSGGSNDLQLFAYQRDTQVSITSLSQTTGLNVQGHHDFTVDFDVPVGTAPIVTRSPSGSRFQALPTEGDIQHFGSDAWAGELLRIVSNRPVTVINGDYDTPNFGAYIPFVPPGRFLPPHAVLAQPHEACPGQPVELNASDSFDQDNEGSLPGIARYDWDFGDGASLANGGPAVSHVYSSEGVFEVTVTVTDDDAAPNTQTDTGMVTITVLPADTPGCDAPPAALCQDPTRFTDFGVCSTAANVDAGSFDPEGGAIALSQIPAEPYALDATAVVLTATDSAGLSATCAATVTVFDPEPPAIDCNAPVLADGTAPALSFTSTVSDNCQPPASVTVQVTAAECFDNDLDDDALPDDLDQCRDSDLSDVLVIADCDTGVINLLLGEGSPDLGCTFSDLIIACGENARNHGEFVSCVAHLTNDWKSQGLITGQEKGVIQSCAAQAPIPPGHPGHSGGLRGSRAKNGEACQVDVTGGTVTFPETPNSGLLSWTVDATDDSGNVATQTCTVLVQDPDSPLSNLPPVAGAGSDQRAVVGGVVTLDGTSSADLGGGSLTYQWSLASAPAGSAAALSDPSASQPSFAADRPGDYLAELVVNDGAEESAPTTVTVSVLNSQPVAVAGGDLQVYAHDTVALDGSGSFDPDGDALSYAWSLAVRPDGSASTLSDPMAVDPTFVPNALGVYVVQLAVDDGQLPSPLDAVLIRVVNAPPVADAGSDQSISVFDLVQLDGSASADADGDPLSFNWSFISQPAGSVAALSNATAVDPTFVADLDGEYQLELTVHDGHETSLADTVSIVTVNTPPVADAGEDQVGVLGDTLELDGSGSSDVDGDPLTYQWTLVSVPPGSAATLSDPTAVNPTLATDLRGAYELVLTVDDGQRPSRQPDSVTVTILNRPPVADAGIDQFGFVTDQVTLDGSASSDPDGDPLSYDWSLVTVPAGSAAALSDPAAVDPSFVVDLAGTYDVQLVVNDGFVDGPPDTVVIETLNTPPVADAGPDQTTFVGATVALDGSGSSDIDGDPLSFLWGFVSVPGGSGATLSDPTAVAPSFVADAQGDYVVELIVDDGEVSSDPDTVTVSTVNAPPVADAGPDQTVFVTDTVQLDGSGSSDVDGDPLEYLWSFVSAPAGSGAVLSDPTAVDPTFFVDLAGDYVLELRVFDGDLISDPDTVVVSTANTAPVANAGPDQTVEAGDTVFLTGDASFDVDGDPLTFSWSLTVVPAGSTAALTDADTPVPFFTADLEGTYVAQLIVNDGEFDSDPDTVSVEAGETLTTVPDVRGLPETDAEAAILAADLVVGNVASIHSNTVPAGQVINQDPAGGTLRPEGSTVNLVVSLGAAPVVDIVVRPESEIILAGNGQQYTAYGIREDGTSVDLTFSAAWSSTDPSVASVDGNGLALGVAGGTVAIEAASGGVVGSAGLTVVDVVADTTPPTGQLTSLDGVSESLYLVPTVTHPVDVIGTADDANFLKYDLAVSPSGDDAFVTIASDTVPVVDGVLGTFDPTLLLNTLYDVRLRVFDRGGSVTTSTVAVQVDGNMKVGNLSLVFTDLVIPMAGLPIAVQRVYDSRDKRVGDFGAGWRLGLNTLEVRTHSIHGEGWFVGTGAGFPITYYLDPIQIHKVSITLPDGKVEEFDFTPMPSSSTLVPFNLVNPAYTPRTGTLGTLSVSPAELRVTGVQPGPVTLVNFSNFETYDPQTFFYTSVDGRVFVINKERGVTQIQEPNGNSLNISATGLIHSSGRSVNFHRDGSGRITTITDPLGNEINYNYDGHSDLIEVTDQIEKTTSYRYSAASPHLLEKIIDPEGVELANWTFDLDERLELTCDAEANCLQMEHDVPGRRETTFDAAGRRTVYIYDDRGNVLSATDALSNVTEYQYDVDDNLTQVNDAEGGVTTYTYDERGNVTSRTEPHSPGQPAEDFTTTYTYNQRTDIASITLPSGAEYHFFYDGSGNEIEMRDGEDNVLSAYEYRPDGLVTQIGYPFGTEAFDYDDQGNLIERVDEFGNVSTVIYNEMGRLVEMTESDGSVSTFNYDGLGRTTSADFGRGLNIQYEYDIGDSWTRVSAPTIGEIERQLTPAGRLATWVSPDGGEDTYEYDASGLTLSETNAVGSTIRYTYDDAGQLESVTNAAGGVTTFERDGRRRILKSTNHLGHATSFNYTQAGRLASMTDALGRTSSFSYTPTEVLRVDPLGREYRTVISPYGLPTEWIHPDGTSRTFTYQLTSPVVEAQEFPTSVTFESGRIREFAYDGLGQLVEAADFSGFSGTYDYDGYGRLVTITGPTDEVRSIVYNGINKVDKIIYSNGGEKSFTYGLNYLPQTVTLPSGTTISYEYDDAGREIRRQSSVGETIRSYWNTGGSLAKIEDGTGITVYSYGPLGYLAAIEYPNGARVSNQRDPIGQVLEVTIEAPGLTPLVTTYGYDAVGNLTSMVDPTGGTTIFEYDAADRLETRTLPNGVTTSYTYYDRDQIRSIIHRRPDGVVLASVAYEREMGEMGGVPKKIIREDGSYVELRYDAALRLGSETYFDALHRQRKHISYSYDAAGNRLARVDDLGEHTYAYEQGYRLASVTDPSGMMSESYSYDLDGRVSSINRDGTQIHLSYDANDYLLRVADNSSGTEIDYVYDGSGRRVLAANGSEERRFLAAPALGEGLESTHAILNASGGLVTGYVYAGEFPVLRFGPEGPVYYLTDAMGSVIALADGAGESVASFEYDSFGNLTSASGSASATPAAAGGDFRFHGAWLESTTGLYHFRARDYDSRVGRFLSRDPVDPDLLEPESLNPYIFAYSNPHIYRDPTGLFTMVQLNGAGSARSVLASVPRLAATAIREQIKDEVFTWLGGKAIEGIATALTGINIDPGLSAQDIGTEFGRKVVQTVCTLLPENVQDKLFLEVPIGIRGAPRRDGIHCKDVDHEVGPRPNNDNLGRTRSGFKRGSWNSKRNKPKRPDFLISNHPPSRLAIRIGNNTGPTTNKSVLIGEIKKGAHLIKARDPQFKTIMNHAAKYGRRFAMYVVYEKTVPSDYDNLIGAVEQATAKGVALWLVLVND